MRGGLRNFNQRSHHDRRRNLHAIAYSVESIRSENVNIRRSPRRALAIDPTEVREPT